MFYFVVLIMQFHIFLIYLPVFLLPGTSYLTDIVWWSGTIASKYLKWFDLKKNFFEGGSCGLSCKMRQDLVSNLGSGTRSEVAFPQKYPTFTKLPLWLFCLMVLEKAKSWDKPRSDVFFWIF